MQILNLGSIFLFPEIIEQLLKTRNALYRSFPSPSSSMAEHTFRTVRLEYGVIDLGIQIVISTLLKFIGCVFLGI